MSKNLKNTKLLQNVFFVAIFLLPNSIIYYGIMYLFLLLTMENSFPKRALPYFLVIAILFSFILNIGGYFNLKDLLVALNISFLLFFFPYTFKNVSINIKTIYIISFAILLSQLIFTLEITPLSNLVESIYKRDESEHEFTRFITSSFRNGGLYYNPNQASKYLTSLLTLVLVLNFKNKDKLVISLLLLISVFMTGSRTGFIVAVVIFTLYSVFILKSKLTSFFMFLFGGLIIFIQGIGTRSLNIQETGSFDYKINALFDYISKVSLDGNYINLLFGNFTTSYPVLLRKYSLSSLYEFGFDAEIGMLVSSYGLMFILLYILFYIGVFKKLNRTNFIIIIPFLLWPFTSTILFSIKTSIVYMSVLSIVIGIKKQNSK